MQADVSREADLAHAFSEIESSMPRLRGVVHAAGIVDTDFVERQTWDRFASVFPAKIDGAWNLHKATASRALDFFVLFSSTASVFGALGQVNYAGANAFLDALASYRRACGLPGLTINWGPWADVGMASRLGDQIRQRWAVQGVKMLSSSDGIAAFAQALRLSEPSQVLAIGIDWSAFVANYPQIDRAAVFAAMAAGREQTAAGLISQLAELRRTLDEATPDQAERLVHDFVLRQFAEALGFESPDALDDELGFLEMGVDSLIATRVMLTLNEALRLRLPMSAMFEHRTIAALTAEIMRVRAADAEAAAQGDGPRPEETAVSRIVPSDTNEPAPLSSAQEGLWFVSRFETNEPAYNEAFVMRIQGEADATVLGRALNEIVRRHEALRTVFQVTEDGPVQIVLPPAPVDLAIDAFTAGLDALPARLTMEVRKPFELDRGPLVRACLLRLGPADHVLLVVTHHLVFDGWSYGLLTRELSALCEAYRAGLPSPFPELPIQYRDFARWQRRRLAAGDLDDQLAYWQQEIANVPVLQWPSAARTTRTFGGATSTFTIAKADEAALAALGEREGATLPMTLFALYVAWLYRYTRQQDFAVGWPVAGRAARETASLIGLFINVLPLRAHVDGRMTFRDLLARVRQSALGAFSHQDLPFNYLVQKSGLARDPRVAPIFQVMFVVENAPASEVSLPGLRMSPIRVDFSAAKFDLTLMFEPNPSGLDGWIEYNTALFDETFASAMVQHYQRLLSAVVADPDRRVADLPLLSDAERGQLVFGWNDTAVAYEREPASLVEWVERQAARTPEAMALWTETGTWTYADLHAQANQLAQALRRRGVGAESRVAVWIERSAPLIVSLLAVVKTGAAFVPLDPTHPPARLAGQLADAQVAVVLTSQACVSDVPAGPYAIEVVDAPEAAWRQESSHALSAPAVAPGQMAYMIYTSGSTGQPKGAMNTQAGIANRLAWMQSTYGLTTTDRVLHKTSNSFDVSVWEVFWPLGTGATLVLARPGGHREPSYLADVIQRAVVTVMHFVPTMLEAFVGAGGLSACGEVRLIVSSGEALPGPLAMRCREAWSGRLENLYGPTEAAIDVTWQPCTLEASAGAVVPIGRPVANTQTYVLDEIGEPAPLGVVGELYLGGVQLGRGYWQDPLRTAERFVPDALSGQTGARLYRTGDLARVRRDGAVEYVGRVDHQVKIRGHRVELGEIEAALRQQPEVRDAAVMLRIDGEPRLVAYVVAAPGGLPPMDTLRARLRQQLPDAMLPSAIVVLDALPVTPNGKLDRRALPAPPTDRPALGAPAAPPRTAVEEALAEIWRQVLQIDRVGIYDNFFALGGHSLLAVQVFSRVRKAFDVELPLSMLLDEPTIAQMARAIVDQRRGGASAEVDLHIVHEENMGPAPLSPAQLRLWFITRVETDEPVYNEALALRLSGPIQVSVWEAVFTEIIRRHETLRTVFSNSEEGPVQLVQPPAAVPVSIEDVSDTPESGREEALRQAIAEDLRKPFNLSQGPLWRVRLIRLAPDEHALVLVMHHIITDARSYGVLTREAALLYDAFSNGQPSPLPELPIQYGDYTRWQREQLDSARLQTQLAYWQQTLDEVGPIEWGSIAQRRSRQTYRGATERFEIPPQIAARLHHLSAGEDATLFMTLLAGWFALVHRYTQQRDFVIGTPVAGRTAKETEPLIGLFANLLAIRGRIDRSTTFRALLARIRQQSLDAFSNPDIPFEYVVDRLAGRRHRRVPFVQAAFVLQNAPASNLPLGALRLDAIPVDRDTSKFDLLLMMHETADGLQGAIEYSTDLFGRQAIAGMIRHYQQLLDAAAAAPDARVAELPLLASPERAELLGSGHHERRAPHISDARLAAAIRESGAQELPASDWRLYLLDAAMELVPVGVTGEIYVGGAGVARNAVESADTTADRFVPDPFATAPGARLYRTGELARWTADGSCELLGRPDTQVDPQALAQVTDEQSLLSASYAPPRTPLETTLATIWAEVLRVDRVGIHDNFFDLGGASLSALEIMARLADTGVPLEALDPAQIFALQTVADVAAAIGARAGSVAQSL
jgi:amino acid adenylation domain-containing protein